MHIPFFVVRTALESVDVWVSWGRSAGPEAISPDRHRLRRGLEKLLCKPAIRNAITYSSPTLMAALPHWIEDPGSSRGRRIEAALVRYLSRFCGRATPFGLSAASSLGFPGAETCLRLTPAQEDREVWRVDPAFLREQARAFARDPEIREGLPFRTCPDWYEVDRCIHFLEANPTKAGTAFAQVAVEASPELVQLLDAAGKGGTLERLAQIQGEDGTSQREAMDNLQELASVGLLLPGLVPPVTGLEALDAWMEGIEHLPGEVRKEWEAFQAGLRNRNRHGAVPSPRAAGAPAGVPLQADLIRELCCDSIGEDVLGPVRKCIGVFRDLFGRRPAVDLSPFKKSFLQRFGAREVPFLTAMDPCTGIGFPQGTGTAALALDHDWLPVHDLLLGELLASERAGRAPIQLSSRELEPYFLPDSLPLPDSFAVVIRLERMAGGGFRPLVTGKAWGPPGIRMLGRLCNAWPELAKAVTELTAREQALQPGAILAEVAFAPSEPDCSLVSRPVLRAFEIPFLGDSGAAPSRLLPLKDLRLSVRDDRVLLRSARLGKEVLPRISVAHDPDDSAPAAYRFLWALQSQGVCNPQWDWGPMEAAGFLPRVCLDGVTVAPARWKVRAQELRAIASLDDGARESAFRALCESRGIPGFFILVEGDRKLPVDCGNLLSMDAFLNLACRRPDILLLEEMLPEPQALGVCGPSGLFTHEVVLPFIAASGPGPEPVKEAVQETSPNRHLLPGSECLFARIHCAEASHEILLRRLVGPWIRSAQNLTQVRKWWFFRSTEPVPHLRIRIFGPAPDLTSGVLEDLRRRAESFLASDLLARVELDTYERELERFGAGPSMEAAETLFWADSEAALSLLETLSSGIPRWKVCLLAMDQMLEDLGFVGESKVRALHGIRAAHFSAFGLDGSAQSALGALYRKERLALKALIQTRGKDCLPEAARVLAKRSHAIREGAASRLALAEEQVRSRRTAAFLHLCANRYLGGESRTQETMLYDFLFRLARAQDRDTPRRPGSPDLRT